MASYNIIKVVYILIHKLKSEKNLTKSDEACPKVDQEVSKQKDK